MPLTRYPEDITGVASSNHIVSEMHVSPVSPTQPYRVIVPRFAPFFVTGLIVTNMANPLVPLVLGVDYTCAELSEEVTIRTGKEAYQSIVLMNTVEEENIRLNYQTIGGLYTYDTTGLAEEINGILNNAPDISYNDLQQKPAVFPPAAHTNTTEDLVAGFEPLITAIERLTQIISYSGNPAFEKLTQDISAINGLIASTVLQATEDHNVSVTAHADLRVLLARATVSPDVGNLLVRRPNGIYYAGP